MRTLVGIDSDRLYGSALTLVGRLRFADNEVTLAHVGTPAAPILAPGPTVYPFYDKAAIEAATRRVAAELLEEARDVANASGLGGQIETVYAVGNSSTVLTNLADERRMDLVAVGSGRRGALESFFLGSVGRALAIGARQSFLVAKGDSRSGPVRAVFATDHSEYANRCFARLLQMAPQGLAHVTIVTAIESGDHAKADDDAGETTLTEIESTMEAEGQRMVERLQATGRTAEFRLIEGHPIEVVKRTMAETESELVILGARGRGLIERVLIGSLALHTVAAEPYSAMVIRIPEETA